jgi:hypothetical protein
LAKAEVAEVLRADSLLERLRSLNRETAEILREARTTDNGLALKAIARAERQIELEGRLLTDVKDAVVVEVRAERQEELLRALTDAELQTMSEIYAAAEARIAEQTSVR